MSQSKPAIDFAVGGQALMEGVMMRSPSHNVICVRTPEGKIIHQVEYYQNLIKRIKILNIPLVRGVINMFEMLLIGTKALNFSSQVALGEDPLVKDKKEGKWTQITVIFSIIFGLALAILLFKFIPLLLATFISSFIPALNDNYLLFNLVDAVLKTAIFVGYIALMSLVPDLKRVFRYHGAEHKSIMTYEHGKELTVDNARSQTRFHPRCGTSFILLVFLISIAIFTLLPRQTDLLTNFSLRFLALPLIAGLSYEILKLSAKKSGHWFFRLVAAPGLLMQRLTTAEPDDSMLEVALKSLKLALEAEQNFQNNKNVP